MAQTLASGWTIDGSTITASGNVLSAATASSNPLNFTSSPLTFTYNSGSAIMSLDSSGNLTISGWTWVKGKNRNYQQNLTASTTTSTTAVLLGTSIGFTPKFSGYIIIDASLRINNDTVADGIAVYIYQGSTSGALTTQLDTETTIPTEDSTVTLHYELSGQTVGTATYISLAFNAVIGGTASAKIVSFTVEEI